MSLKIRQALKEENRISNPTAELIELMEKAMLKLKPEWEANGEDEALENYVAWQVERAMMLEGEFDNEEEVLKAILNN